MYSIRDEDVLLPMGRPQRPDWRMRCELWVFLLRREDRVFVAGGEFGFDGLAREADGVEIEALADRFEMHQLREILHNRVQKSKDSTMPEPRYSKPWWKFWKD